VSSDALTPDAAGDLLGREVITPAMVADALGQAIATRDVRSTLPGIDREAIEEARRRGATLVFRPRCLADGTPLTLAWLHERFARSTGPRFRGEDPWFLAEPFARSETPQPGWALVGKDPWRETLNRTYEEGGRVLERLARPLPSTWRRRSAVEAAYDCLIVAITSGARLLADGWDWTSTAATDGGRINVGGFGPEGLDVLSYSKAVKHGALGICPTIVAG